MFGRCQVKQTGILPLGPRRTLDVPLCAVNLPQQCMACGCESHVTQLLVGHTLGHAAEGKPLASV